MSRPTRIAVLWQQMSSHSRASLDALTAQGAEVMVVYRGVTPEAPYAVPAVTPAAPGGCWTDAPDEAVVRRQVEEFGPDVLLVCSWNVGAYRHISRGMRGRALRVLFMDNAWLGTPKQWAGRFVSRAVVRPAYDTAFVPGDRQAAFARRLGFDDRDILWGAYTCDYDAFSAVSHAGRRAPPARFVYAGRLAPEKGVDVLADAYRQYRRTVANPWPLSVCGVGQLDHLFAGIPGVDLLGFVQPGDLPQVFEGAGCLVLPSRFEPWGVVIHEATAAGLAVVCTTACGATSRLVVDGYNGAVVAPGDAGALARGLARISHGGGGASGLEAMSRRSGELAAQFTPARWASYLLDRSREHRQRLGLG